MKTLITHINPHLDDIAAIWLFSRFSPDFKDAQIRFISQTDLKETTESDGETIYLGVGRGKFDEHKGDLEDCAASLVAKFLKEVSLYPKSETEALALDELVEWVRLDDLGRLNGDSFSVPAFIRPFESTPETSLSATELGEQILDRIYQVLIKKHLSLKDWESRKEFDTTMGKLVVIESENVSRAFCKGKEGDIFLMINPKDGSVQYYSDKLDLGSIYEKAKELDSEADWFLHQSHHMVICGAGSAPNSKKTKLSKEELIKIVE